MENDPTGAVDTPTVPIELDGIGVIELLECDSRPTFVLDLERTQHSDNALLHAVFSNTSLRRLPRMLNPVHEKEGSWTDIHEWEQYSSFTEWATISPTYGHIADETAIPFGYQNLTWTCITLRRRWRIISGSPIGLSCPTAFKKHCQSVCTAPRVAGTQKEEAQTETTLRPTWVNELPASEHVQLFKNTDWSATALGPLEAWSGCLRQMTRFLMADSRPASMFW